MSAFPHVLGKRFYWFRRQKRESQLRSTLCALVSMNMVEGDMLTDTDFPLLSQEGVGDQAARPSLCFCAWCILLIFFTQPPTVLNPQNYSYFSIKWEPRGLAIPTAGVQAPLFSSVALIDATWLRRSWLYAVICWECVCLCARTCVYTFHSRLK